jgi:hypothetical protein
VSNFLLWHVLYLYYFSLHNNIYNKNFIATTECDIEVFDCTINGEVPSHIKSRTRFHKLCLGNKQEQRSGLDFVTYANLHNITGHAHGPSYLKMDIEGIHIESVFCLIFTYFNNFYVLKTGWEHEALPSLLNSRSGGLPMMIAMEVHTFILENGRPNNLDISQMFTFFQSMYNLGGYYVIDMRDNLACRWCVEVIFARVDCEFELRGDEMLAEIESFRMENRKGTKSTFCNNNQKSCP